MCSSATNGLLLLLRHNDEYTRNSSRTPNTHQYAPSFLVGRSAGLVPFDLHRRWCMFGTASTPAPLITSGAPTLPFPQGRRT